MEILEMAVEEKENPAEAQTAQDEIAAEKFPDELREAIWSVISFDRCEANGLTYAEAEQKLGELQMQKVSGLCIVTDETAARIAVKK